MNKVVQKSKSPRQASMTATWCVAQSWLEAVKRSGKKPRKPKLRCLSQCNVDVQNMKCELIENDPTFEVTSSQQSGDAASLEDASTREDEVLH